MNPCDLGEDAPGGDDGPMVTPGSYRVSLVVDGEVVDSQPIQVLPDPGVEMGAAERVAYDNLTTDLHELHRRGARMAATLNTLHEAVNSAAGQIEEEGVPGPLERDFQTFREAWDDLRVRFGVPAPAGGGRGGGGGFGGRGGADPADVLARVDQLKGELVAFWEEPSDALLDRYYRVRPEMETALDEAEAMVERARALSERLDDEGVEMRVPGGS
jgi:hypothetical protein